MEEENQQLEENELPQPDSPDLGKEHDQQPSRWEGKATAKVAGASADYVWPLLEDYCNIHKWLPNLDSASLAEGEPGELGCVRHCMGAPLPGSDDPTFTDEKLVAIDTAQRSLSYQVLDNNIGLGEYVGTIRVLPESDDACTIEWSFSAEPVPGWSVEKIEGYVGYSVQSMAETIEEEIASAE